MPKQEMLAELLDCSLGIIQSVESGRVRLSEKLAQRAAFETGVSVEWLLKNDTTAPPVDHAGNPFTKETYERHRVESSRPKEEDLEHVNTVLTKTLTRAAALLDVSRRKGNFYVCAFKLHQALDQLEHDVTGGPLKNTMVAMSWIDAKPTEASPDLKPLLKALRESIKPTPTKKGSK